MSSSASTTGGAYVTGEHPARFSDLTVKPRDPVRQSLRMARRRAWPSMLFMPKRVPFADARPGDWLEAHGLHGEPSRRGQIVDVLGGPGHQHFQVRWNEEHESIVFPADGVTIERQAVRRRR